MLNYEPSISFGNQANSDENDASNDEIK